MNNIDPYNNAPQNSNCRSKPNQQYNSNEPLHNKPIAPPFTHYIRNQATSPNQAQTNSIQQQKPDVFTENHMLRSDLETAIKYIYQLGGKWPPPGH